MVDWKDIGKTLGRVGTGIGTGVATYQTQMQPDYMFIPRYMGDGLASTTVIDNTRNKQRQLNQMLGTGDYLGSLFNNQDEYEYQPENQGYGSDSLFNTLGRLSTLGGALGDWAAEQRGKIMPNGKLLFSKMFSNVGDFGNRLKSNPLTNDTIV